MATGFPWLEPAESETGTQGKSLYTQSWIWHPFCHICLFELGQNVQPTLKGIIQEHVYQENGIRAISGGISKTYTEK